MSQTSASPDRGSQSGAAVPAARREVRRQRGLPHPRERRLDLGHLEAGGRTGRGRWRPDCCRSVSSPRTGSVSPRPLGSSGSWPTWRSCAPARRPPPSTRARTPRTPPTSWPTPTRKIVFAEDDTQLKKLTEQRSELPNLTKVVLFDGDLGRRLGDHPGRPRRPGREVSGRACLLRAQGRRRDQARPAGDADLHLRDHRQAERCAAAPRGLGVHRRRDRRHGAARARTICSCCGCRWRTPSARC